MNFQNLTISSVTHIQVSVLLAPEIPPPARDSSSLTDLKGKAQTSAPTPMFLFFINANTGERGTSVRDGFYRYFFFFFYKLPSVAQSPIDSQS